MGIETSLASDSGKNLIINGNLDFWQRNTSFTNAGGYTADRFFVAENGSAQLDVIRVSNTDLPPSPYSLRVEPNTAMSLPITTNDFCRFEHKVEGLFIRESYDKDLIYAFDIKTNLSGTHCVALQNSDRSRSLVLEFNVSQSNVWERIVLKIPKIESGIGTWLTDTGVGLIINHPLYFGDTTKETPTLGVWQNGDFRFTSNIQNLGNSTSNYVEFRRFSLHEGIEEIPFKDLMRDYQKELGLCRRYFEKSYDLDTPVGSITRVGVSAVRGTNPIGTTTIFMKEPKRNNPVVSFYSPVTGSVGVWRNESGEIDITVTEVSNGVFGQNEFGISASPLGTNQLANGHWVADSEL